MNAEHILYLNENCLSPSRDGLGALKQEFNLREIRANGCLRMCFCDIFLTIGESVSFKEGTSSLWEHFETF